MEVGNRLAHSTKLTFANTSDGRSEAKGLVTVLIEDSWIVTLFPMFVASNWFYTFQGNDYNAVNFTLRTRSFNGLWSNFSNMLGVLFMGYALDFRPKLYSRRLRARVGLVFLFIATMAIWGGGWYFARDAVRGVTPNPRIDV